MNKKNIYQKQIEGKQLKAGDVIEVWWKPHRDIVEKIAPYQGKLPMDKIAYFSINKNGMSFCDDTCFLKKMPY